MILYDLVIEGIFVDPINGLFNSCAGIKNGMIERIGGSLTANAHRRYLASTYIFPGFIDMHAHLREDSSGRWNYKEDFLSGTKSALAGGITMVCDMPNTPKPATSREEIAKKTGLAKKGCVDVLLYAGVCKDNIDRLEYMADLVAGYKIFTCESTGVGGMDYGDIDRAVDAIKNTGKPIVFHCEDPRHFSSASSYSESRPIEAELAAIKNVLEITRRHSVRAHITHITSGRSAALIDHGRGETCDATPHHIYFNNTQESERLRMNPPLRNEHDRLSLLEALRAGMIDALATDHAPHTPEEKMAGACGMPNLETYGAFVSWLISQGVSPEAIARATSYKPAQILGIPDVGRIAQGYCANFTIVDMSKSSNIKGPYHSKCNWSAFEGVTFPGRVVGVIINGKIRL
jgi:dihydroorotase